MGQSSVDRYFNVDQKKKKKDFPQMNRIKHCSESLYLENKTFKAVILTHPYDVSDQCFPKDQKDEIISYSIQSKPIKGLYLYKIVNLNITSHILFK